MFVSEQEAVCSFQSERSLAQRDLGIRESFPQEVSRDDLQDMNEHTGKGNIDA